MGNLTKCRKKLETVIQLKNLKNNLFRHLISCG